MRRLLLLLPVACLAAACGPSGTITGKVIVQGGNAGNIAVTAVGPNSGGASTGNDGAYTIGTVGDGDYVVSATVPGSVEGEQRVAVKVADKKGNAADLKFTIPDASGTVTGKVAFSDAGNPANVPVSLVGPVSRGGASGADGSFTFDKLPPGGYVLTAQASGTLEHGFAVAVSVTSNQTTSVPTLTFTAVGTIAGKATKGSSTGNAGIVVAIAGSGQSAITGDDGNYLIRDVPAGAQVLVATAPGFDPATSPLVVVRGPNAAPNLSLSPTAQPTGNVNGSVIILEHYDSSIITVSADGTAFSVQAQADGRFTLPLPSGHWDIIATAPHYPKQWLGRIEVTAGADLHLPLAVLTPWQTIPIDPAIQNTSFQLAPDGDHAVYAMKFPGGWAYFMVDLRAATLRLFYGDNGASATQFAISRHGRRVAWPAGAASWQMLDLTNTEAKSIPVATNAFGGANPVFSSDEGHFLVADGAKVHRVSCTTGIDDPITAVSWMPAGPTDTWLLRDVPAAAFTLSLAGPTGAATQITTNTSSFVQLTAPQYKGEILALTDCGASCTFRLFDPAAPTVKTANGTFPPAMFSGVLPTRSPSWVYVAAGAPPNAWFVKLTDATVAALPAAFLVSTGRFDVSPDGTKIAYTTGSGPYNLLQEAMPPTGTSSALETSTGPFRVSWMSNTRYLAFDFSATPHHYESINGGALTNDTDLVSGFGGCLNAPGSYGTAPFPCCAWRRASDNKLVFAARDFADYPLDLGSSGILSGLAESADGKYEVFAGVHSDLGQFTAVRDTANPVAPKVYPGLAAVQINNTVSELTIISQAGVTGPTTTGVDLLVLDTGQRIPLLADGVSTALGGAMLAPKTEATGKRQLVGSRTQGAGVQAWAWMILP